jgi:ABC-type transport system involved in multi-copper enzyme maturation permease subunit
MLLQILTIARNTFVESIRQPIFFVLVMLCGVFQLFNTWSAAFAMGYTESGEVSGDNKMLLDMGLATVMVCGTLLAAFIATAVVSREIENKTVLTVVSKPVARPSVVIGKYLGVAGALVLAVIAMLIFLLMGIRHGVMSMASDDLDMPVIAFTGAALILAIGAAVWCNYFYGWYFSQTCMTVLTPALVAAYVLVLLVNKKWQWQHIQDDFKPQITFACMALTMGILVLAAVATAVSTRVGQVMTIVVCAGVFVFGLMSNYLIGRHVFNNQQIGIISSVKPLDPVHPGFDNPGDGYAVNLINPPSQPVHPGDSFYYSTSPAGFPLLTGRWPAFKGDAAKNSDLMGAAHPALIITAVNGSALTVRKAGEAALSYDRVPEKDDYVFLQPTRTNAAALVLWGVIPNMQDFWLLDAVSQNQRIPPEHMAKLAIYALAQITAFLGLGVVLFQRRDVG